MAEWTDEEEYTQYLREERERYAWVMRVYGGLGPEQAVEAAVQRYPYDPPGTRFRRMIFHDEAWHWAMLAIEGEDYPQRRPDLVQPPVEYRALG